eukprot:5055798-Pleurochrysis_carterae.AAC.2
MGREWRGARAGCGGEEGGEWRRIRSVESGRACLRPSAWARSQHNLKVPTRASATRFSPTSTRSSGEARVDARQRCALRSAPSRHHTRSAWKAMPRATPPPLSTLLRTAGDRCFTRFKTSPHAPSPKATASPAPFFQDRLEPAAVAPVVLRKRLGQRLVIQMQNLQDRRPTPQMRFWGEVQRETSRAKMSEHRASSSKRARARVHKSAGASERAQPTSLANRTFCTGRDHRARVHNRLARPRVPHLFRDEGSEPVSVERGRHRRDAVGRGPAHRDAVERAQQHPLRVIEKCMRGSRRRRRYSGAR